MAKLRTKIQMAARRRARQPRPQTIQQVKLEASRAEINGFTRSNARDLLAIETALVQASIDNPAVDDAVVELALRASIHALPATTPEAEELVALLETLREQRSCEPETWQTGLRVVYRSVKTRSDCRPGDGDYLEYAAYFIQRAAATTR